MALRWNWDEKCGELEAKAFNPETKKIEPYKYTFYDCNGLAMWLWETEEQYGLAGFFADEEHAKNCFGISKGYKENIHENWIKVRLNVSYPKMRKLAQIIVKAFDNIKIELYKEEK